MIVCSEDASFVWKPTEMLPKTKTEWFDVTADDVMCECRVCGASKRHRHHIRNQTRFTCAPCGSVALCVVPCFRQYHTLVNYEHDNSSSDDH